MQWIQARWKAVAALLGLVLTYLQVYQTTNPNHWVTVVIGVLTVLVVHQVPNKPTGAV